jgi:hypothetical protein
LIRIECGQRYVCAAAPTGLAVVLKLFPVFCVALAARFNRRSFIFTVTVAVFALPYLGAIFSYIFLIRRRVPTTWVLSYGYKAAFPGFNHLRTEAELNPFALADTWVPTTVGACSARLRTAWPGRRFFLAAGFIAVRFCWVRISFTG